jgi:hypothetical protein
MILITGIIGIVMLAAFLGIMIIWVPAPPLIIIVLSVMALLIYDFVMTLLYGEDYAARGKQPPPPTDDHPQSTARAG